MPLIELVSTSKHYSLGAATVVALRPVTLTIEPGELLALWGPSGSGKSTLCHLIGLLDAPTTGTVQFDGADTATLTDDECADLRNRSVGFIFQGFNLVPVLTALENVMLPLQIRGQRGSPVRRTAADALAAVGLASYLGHRPSELSGGQQQRVAIARAFVNEPRLVIADEATANLDTDTAHALMDLIVRINAERQTTFVFATHDQRLLAGIPRRILLKDGAIAEDTAPRPCARLAAGAES
jgi:putative ABC transport system ATP-binding protein